MGLFALGPRGDLRMELLRSLAQVTAVPLNAAHYWLVRDVLRQEGEDDLSDFPPLVETAPIPALPKRPLRIALSCAESSGELHAASVASALFRLAEQAGAPAPELSGLGGEVLAKAGVRVLADTVTHAAMGVTGVLSHLPRLLDKVENLTRQFHAQPPDLFLPVDSPALHVPLARIARRRGVPVLHFVTPQYWGWAPWRVNGYRRAVDRALTILPFEPAWFERNGVRAEHVGHPLLDRLPTRGEAQVQDASRTLALLPGSRAGTVVRNLPWMLRCAAKLAERVSDLDLVVLQEGTARVEEIRTLLEGSPLPARIAVQDLHAELRRSHAALSVSGTILIDLLHERLPTVVIYRVEHRREVWMARHMLTLPWFASPNLLAGEQVLPEFCFRGEGPIDRVVEALEASWTDPERRRKMRAGLERAARRLGLPGASERAARHALQLACARCH